MSACGITCSARRKNASASGDKSNTDSARLIRPLRFSAVMGAPDFSERGYRRNSFAGSRVTTRFSSSAGTTSSAVGNVPSSKGIPCKRCCNWPNAADGVGGAPSRLNISKFSVIGEGARFIRCSACISGVMRSSKATFSAASTSAARLASRAACSSSSTTPRRCRATPVAALPCA